ncbi:hypothetical protein [Streptomyces sp. SPB074]|uniref:hypothetical protein n=1 Tax=Streptomyces sp. (strain SPB074) TaxID=465543 RepID=UPI0002DA606A|nr:hypothetical protein [Streptomyces sp. SPB074]
MSQRHIRSLLAAGAALVVVTACGSDGGDGKPRPSASVPEVARYFQMSIAPQDIPPGKPAHLPFRFKNDGDAPFDARFEFRVTPLHQPALKTDQWELGVSDDPVKESGTPVEFAKGPGTGGLSGTTSLKVPQGNSTRYLTLSSDRHVEQAGEGVRVNVRATVDGKVVGNVTQDIDFLAVSADTTERNKPLEKAGVWTEFTYSLKNLTRTELSGLQGDLALGCLSGSGGPLADQVSCVSQEDGEQPPFTAVEWRADGDWKPVPGMGGESEKENTPEVAGTFADFGLSAQGSQELRIRVKPSAAMEREDRTGRLLLTLTHRDKGEMRQYAEVRQEFPLS